MATGVARPKAQGQEITKTAMAEDKASPKGEPKIIQTAKVIIAIDITTGTKTRATFHTLSTIIILKKNYNFKKRCIIPVVVKTKI